MRTALNSDFDSNSAADTPRTTASDTRTGTEVAGSGTYTGAAGTATDPAATQLTATGTESTLHGTGTELTDLSGERLAGAVRVMPAPNQISLRLLVPVD